ncbi:17482_t:CDS:2 [Dentiscutata erythropus]|uniref:17482_t:CDS:1 n=1 Tax=Dentiscutata erythropus TaxID=1348616 RepID=A0A9N9NN33_9GLOM|nr:17482_t:CDS:2 [Dentiscutata erythropus]
MSVYDKIKERAKEYNFSAEEIEILNRAKSKFSMHMRIGSLAGLVIGGAIAKVQKIRTFGTIWLCFGTTLFGSQAGMVTGSIASIKLIRSSNSQRIMEFISEMQQQVHPNRPLPTPNKPPNQPPNSEDYRFENGDQTTLSDEFEKENKTQYSFHQRTYDDSGNSVTVTDEMVSDINANESDYNYGQSQKPSHKSSWPPQDNNSWNRNRTQNTTSTTWDKIRANAKVGQQKQNNDNLYGSQQKSIGKDDGDRPMMDLPRTREEFDELRRGGKIRTNQFGDTEIRYDE